MLNIKYYWILYLYCTSAVIFNMFLFLHRQCESAREWAQGEFETALDREYDFIVGKPRFKVFFLERVYFYNKTKVEVLIK